MALVSAVAVVSVVVVVAAVSVAGVAAPVRKEPWVWPKVAFFSLITGCPC